MKRSFTSTARKALLRRGRALLRRSQKNGGNATDFLGGLSAGEREELAEIHLALERIERGIFGVCEECSAPVEEARLESKPWVRSCAACDAAQAEAAELELSAEPAALSEPLTH